MTFGLHHTVFETKEDTERWNEIQQVWLNGWEEHAKKKDSLVQALIVRYMNEHKIPTPFIEVIKHIEIKVEVLGMFPHNKKESYYYFGNLMFTLLELVGETEIETRVV